jgi:hypothetical protein
MRDKGIGCNERFHEFGAFEAEFLLDYKLAGQRCAAAYHAGLGHRFLVSG